jgi:choline kinase
MAKISEAVILIAGQGLRLRGVDKNCLKPFVSLLGRPLLSYTLDAVTCAGISTIRFVVATKANE